MWVCINGTAIQPVNTKFPKRLDVLSEITQGAVLSPLLFELTNI